MSTNLRLAIVGCGGMGHRHLMGLVELQQQGLLTLDLVAACDPVAENAESLARLAKAELGAEPVPVPDLASLAAHGVQAIDITSPPALHHHLIAEAAAMGIHVMTEKPVGLTVASSLEICETARSHPDIVISVAENYRRDPINRLARALLDAGAIGAPRLLQMNSVGGQNTHADYPVAAHAPAGRHSRRYGSALRGHAGVSAGACGLHVRPGPPARKGAGEPGGKGGRRSGQSRRLLRQVAGRHAGAL